MIRRDFIKKGILAGALMSPATAYISGPRPEEKQTRKQIRSVLWEELSWPQIKDLAERDAMVIIPVGSIEQHGPHLPVSTDSICTSEVSRRVGERMNSRGHAVVVAPRVWTGVSPHHMLFPGTISFDYDLFSSILKQVCFCLQEHGFSRIVFMNGHGGNVNPLRVLLMDINRQLGRPAFLTTYWSAARGEISDILDTDSGIGHSAEAETSLLLALRPDLVRQPFDSSTGPDRPDPADLREGIAYTFRTYEDRTSIGVIGKAATATREKGERILEAVTENLSEFLSRESLWDISL
ncbi:MAG: creatininase family protein [Balneolaceae bacterium]